MTSTRPPARTVPTTDFLTICISDPATRDASARSATGAKEKCIVRESGVNRGVRRKTQYRTSSLELAAVSGNTGFGLPRYVEPAARPNRVSGTIFVGDYRIRTSSDLPFVPTKFFSLHSLLKSPFCLQCIRWCILRPCQACSASQRCISRRFDEKTSRWGRKRPARQFVAERSRGLVRSRTVRADASNYLHLLRTRRKPLALIGVPRIISHRLASD